MEAKKTSEAESARLQRFDQSGWVRELAMNRHTEDEIRAVLDIFLIYIYIYIYVFDVQHSLPTEYSQKALR